MKIYIAGPITKKLDYKKKFALAEKKLKNMGHIVLNPSFLPDGLKDYMPTCKCMIDQSDALYFLKGWEKSIGSNEERVYANEKNKIIIDE